MPGWHALTEPYRKEGQLNVVGLIQEQHPNRALLFMQWKEMGWPLLVDSLNLLGVTGAPITLFLDEAGQVIAINPRRSDLTAFLAREPVTWDAWQRPDPATLLSEPDLEAVETADRQYLWGGEAGVPKAIAGYRELLEHHPDQAAWHFRLGVAFRKRYDGALREADDFAKAVSHWQRALDLNPNQYIWRRRIQQYGPRLAKPYSFYDWVHEARATIEKRGEQPSPLSVEPGGAEFAYPAKTLVTEDTPENPDPGGRIFRDLEGFVRIETTVVPATVKPGDALRVHVVLRPDTGQKAHWNNEVDGLALWMDEPEDWIVDAPLRSLPTPPQPITTEERRLEFELQTPSEVTGESVTLHGYALYYVCEDVDGRCLYRRQDFEVPVRLVR